MHQPGVLNYELSLDSLSFQDYKEMLQHEIDTIKHRNGELVFKKTQSPLKSFEFKLCKTIDKREGESCLAKMKRRGNSISQKSAGVCTSPVNKRMSRKLNARQNNVSRNMLGVQGKSVLS